LTPKRGSRASDCYSKTKTKYSMTRTQAIVNPSLRPQAPRSPRSLLRVPQTRHQQTRQPRPLREERTRGGPYPFPQAQAKWNRQRAKASPKRNEPWPGAQGSGPGQCDAVLRPWRHARSRSTGLRRHRCTQEWRHRAQLARPGAQRETRSRSLEGGPQEGFPEPSHPEEAREGRAVSRRRAGKLDGDAHAHELRAQDPAHTQDPPPDTCCRQMNEDHPPRVRTAASGAGNDRKRA